jgi:hypothetical protein
VAVDLTDSDTLIASLKRECSPPGTDLFPTATDDEWLGHLQDSFWEARLFGFFEGYTESEGSITPLSGTTDLDRRWQELIVLFAGARVIRNELKNTNTSFRAQAGTVEFEVQNSANLLVAILKDIRSKVDLALAAIGTINSTTVAYVDSLVGREDSIYYGDTYVASGGQRGRGYGSGW